MVHRATAQAISADLRHPSPALPSSATTPPPRRVGRKATPLVLDHHPLKATPQERSPRPQATSDAPQAHPPAYPKSNFKAAPCQCPGVTLRT